MPFAGPVAEDTELALCLALARQEPLRDPDLDTDGAVA